MTATPPTFLEELRIQRWDDHRYYHQSRINQTLHLFSACCFLTTYALIPFDPLAAAMLGWVVAMWSRQIGHFFFEPKGFDKVNQVTFDHKEDIKVGFNLQRKVILFAVWISIPVVIWITPDLGGLLSTPTTTSDVFARVGQAWLGLAFAGLLARTLWLVFTRGPQTGIVWFTKILTDPFNDVRTYYRAPIYLARGQLLDPMDHVESRKTAEAP